MALSPTLDSIGWLSNTAQDAATIYATLRREPAIEPLPVGGMRFATPGSAFFAGLDPSVEKCMDRAFDSLRAAGAHIVAIDVPELSELDRFAPIIPIELIARLGRPRILASRNLFDPVALGRLEGVALDAADYLALLDALKELCRGVDRGMAGFDAWLMPTTPDVATPVDQLRDVQAVQAWNRRAFRNTRPANLCGQCAVSIPISADSGGLPAGLQVACRNGTDRHMFAIALGIEKALVGSA